MIIRINAVLTIYGGRVYFHRPPHCSDKNMALFNFRCDIIEESFTQVSFFKYNFNESCWARMG